MTRLLVRFGKAQLDLIAGTAFRVAGLRPTTLEVEGRPIKLLTGGKGPPLVFIHGFSDRKETWAPIATWLTRRNQVFLPDWPGCGQAPRTPPEASTPRRQAGALLALLDALQLRRVHLGGASMGGGIALKTAHDHPERVRSLTLISSTGPEPEVSPFFGDLDRGHNTLIPDTAADYKAVLALALERKVPLTRSISAYLGADVAGRADHLVPLLRRWREAEGDEGLPDESLSQVDAPTLVLQGESDRVVHPATARALAAGIPDARLRVLAGVGHVPQLEAPVLTGRAVRAFLDSVV